MFVVFFFELRSKLHAGLRYRIPSCMKEHTVVLPVRHTLLLGLSCAQFQSSGVVMGADGNKRPSSLPLDLNASWVNIKTGRKMIILLTLVYYKALFFILFCGFLCFWFFNLKIIY